MLLKLNPKFNIIVNILVIFNRERLERTDKTVLQESQGLQVPKERGVTPAHPDLRGTRVKKETRGSLEPPVSLEIRVHVVLLE